MNCPIHECILRDGDNCRALENGAISSIEDCPRVKPMTKYQVNKLVENTVRDLLGNSLEERVEIASRLIASTMYEYYHGDGNVYY